MEEHEREVVWPEPREDPDEEPAEPWARLLDRAKRWEGWDDFLKEWEERRRGLDP